MFSSNFDTLSLSLSVWISPRMSWITSLLLQLPEGLLLIEKGPLLPGGVDINYKNHPPVWRSSSSSLMKLCAYSLTGDTVNAHDGVARERFNHWKQSTISDSRYTLCYDPLWCSTTVCIRWRIGGACGAECHLADTLVSQN